LQDPPALIPEFLQKWEEGYHIVLAQKTESEESSLFFFIRAMYYKLATSLADVVLLQNVTGTGLYDREVVQAFRDLKEPYPYLRGLIAELGYPVALVKFRQPLRKRGITKNNFFTLYDIAMLGITSHSKVPLRLAAMCGFAMSVVSFLIALGYLVAKLLFWYHFTVGVAPVIIGLFFFGSVQLFFTGILGEYIGWIHTRLQNRPLVIERERINF
jgi:glycosyltransferase involved in cell wall biosynthesis